MVITCTFGAAPATPKPPPTGEGLFAIAVETPATPEPWLLHGLLLLATMLSKSNEAKTFGWPFVRVPVKSALVGVPPDCWTPESHTARRMFGSPKVCRPLSCRTCQAPGVPTRRRSQAPGNRKSFGVTE